MRNSGRSERDQTAAGNSGNCSLQIVHCKLQNEERRANLQFAMINSQFAIASIPATIPKSSRTAGAC
jgi:hypothetical protein